MAKKLKLKEALLAREYLVNRNKEIESWKYQTHKDKNRLVENKKTLTTLSMYIEKKLRRRGVFVQ